MSVVRTHECSVCKRVDAWGDDWSWYGSINDLDDGKPIVKLCSAACKRVVEEEGPKKFRAKVRAR